MHFLDIFFHNSTLINLTHKHICTVLKRVKPGPITLHANFQYFLRNFSLTAKLCEIYSSIRMDLPFLLILNPFFIITTKAISHWDTSNTFGCFCDKRISCFIQFVTFIIFRCPNIMFSTFHLGLQN